MRFNFGDVSIVSVLCLVASGAAVAYGYFKGKKLDKENEEKNKAFEARINNTLRSFDKCIDDLEQQEYEVELAPDVVSQIAHECTQKEAQKMVAPMVAAERADANVIIEKHSKATVEDILDSTKAKTEAKIDELIERVDIRDRLNTVLSNVENRLSKKVERDMEKFEEKCEADYQKLVESKKKLLDIYSDNASEGYALYKNINEKISSK